MAIHLDIRRTRITADSAEYTYGTVDVREGKFRILLTSGETQLIEATPGDIEQRLYLRAAHKIKQAWPEGNLPETAVWAS